MNIPIQIGGTAVLMTRWDRDTAAELIQRHRITGVTGITTMIVDFLANPNLDRYDLSSIVRIGGGIVFGGSSSHVFGHGSGAGSGTFYYQLWFRNTPAMYCTPDGFNTSNGHALDW